MESGHERIRRGSVLEVLGTLGVIASLAFVAMEVHQNTVALRAGAIQRSIDVARQQTQMLATNPSLLRIGLMVDRGEPVSEVEAQQQRWVSVSLMWGLQGLYQQWRMGVLPEAEWHAWHRVICMNMEGRGLRSLWQGGLRNTYIPEFIADVESCPSFKAE